VIEPRVLEQALQSPFLVRWLRAGGRDALDVAFMALIRAVGIKVDDCIQFEQPSTEPLKPLDQKIVKTLLEHYRPKRKKPKQRRQK